MNSDKLSTTPTQSSWGPRVHTESLELRLLEIERQSLSLSLGYSVSSPEVWGWGACPRSLGITGSREPLYLLRQEEHVF